jgi:hypothetical protein
MCVGGEWTAKAGIISVPHLQQIQIVQMGICDLLTRNWSRHILPCESPCIDN